MLNSKFYLIAIALFLAVFTACNDEEDATGVVTLAITDAPADGDSLIGVHLKIVGIEFRKEGGWLKAEGFSGPKTVNLLELTNGEVDLLGDFEVEAGEYTGLRFLLDIEDQTKHQNEGTYLEFASGATEPLFVPSGASSGYKALTSFIVPVNGNITLTADWDARKAIVKAGNSEKFILKPVIRLIANNQAGFIAGTLPGHSTDHNYVVFAYADGKYVAETETAVPAEGEVRFPNAITSSKVKEDASFVVPFLAPGVYDLVIAKFDLEGNFIEVVDMVENVEVKSTETTQISVSI